MRVPTLFLARCWAVFVPRNWTLGNQRGTRVEATRLTIAAGHEAYLGGQLRGPRPWRGCPKLDRSTLLSKAEADKVANGGCRQSQPRVTEPN